LELGSKDVAGGAASFFYGAAALLTFCAKTDLFPPNFVRKPRHSSTIPAFSFAFNEKISCFGEVFANAPAPLRMRKNILPGSSLQQRLP
jgi:hypothetical protein